VRDERNRKSLLPESSSLSFVVAVLSLFLCTLLALVSSSSFTNFHENLLWVIEGEIGNGVIEDDTVFSYLLYFVIFYDLSTYNWLL
jgi:hypothetical protein